MNKVKLIQSMSDASDLTQPQTAGVVDIFFNGMANALAKGWTREDQGIVLVLREGIPKLYGTEPENRERVMIKPKKLPFFKPGKKLKDRVDR